MIGSTVIDVEDRILQKLSVGEKEWRRLNNPASTTPQGKLLIRLDLLTEDQAQRQKPEVLNAPPKMEYELRLVIWSTKECRLPEDRHKVSGVSFVARSLFFVACHSLNLSLPRSLCALIDRIRIWTSA
jgi:hypothetical protein